MEQRNFIFTNENLSKKTRKSCFFEMDVVILSGQLKKMAGKK